MSITYRPDIDGLRALAIVPVVLFHAGVPFISGGFVGVDIFFVISGFLITSIILKDKEAGTFSLAGFWERRARRILPPLAVVVLASITAGWFLYLPQDFERLGEQTFYQAFFASNILFAGEAGYFNTVNDIKPLLHTWSLSVEEQFYVIFPLALVVMWRWVPKFYRQGLAALGIVSFLLAVHQAYYNQTATFYLLPMRMWELLLGAGLALYTPRALSRPQAQTMAWIGLFAILIAVFLYSDKTIFPGLAALLPCGGAALLIWANRDHATSVGRVLSLKPIVFIGLVSYAWYLWHWPVMAFVRYMPFYEFTWPLGLACALGSFVLAVISWRFIERPIRQRRWLPTRRAVYVAAAVCIVTMFALGVVIKNTDGFPHRMNNVVASFSAGEKDTNPRRDECNRPTAEAVTQGAFCHMVPDSNIKPSFIVWGDSHADAAAPVFYALAEQYNKNGLLAMATACPPFLMTERRDERGNSYCRQFNQAVFDYIVASDIDHVVIIGLWASWLTTNKIIFPETEWYEPYKQQHETMHAAAMHYTADRLVAAGKKVYILMDVPTASFEPAHVLAMEALYGIEETKAYVLREKYESRRERDMYPLVEKMRGSGITFIDPADIFCDAQRCRTGDETHSFYYNNNHLSTVGAMQMAPLFAPYFKNKF